MLYKIVAGRSVKELNPELEIIPEFQKLTDRQMTFVILVADKVKNPLGTLPEKVRREKAVMLAGYGMEGTRPDKNAREAIAGKVESIETAILKYRELQWDEDRDTLDTVVAQIQEIKDYMKSDKSKAKDYGKALEVASKLGEKLPSLIEAKQKLESILQVSQEQKPEITTYSSLDLPETEEGDENLSTIDMFWQNQQKSEDND